MRRRCTGAKHITEATGWRRVRASSAVEERSIPGRSMTVRTCGLYGSDHAGISNEKTGEKPVRRKSKGSRVKLICAGLVGA